MRLAQSVKARTSGFKSMLRTVRCAQRFRSTDLSLGRVSRDSEQADHAQVVADLVPVGLDGRLCGRAQPRPLPAWTHHPGHRQPASSPQRSRGPRARPRAPCPRSCGRVSRRRWSEAAAAAGFDVPRTQQSAHEARSAATYAMIEIRKTQRRLGRRVSRVVRARGLSEVCEELTAVASRMQRRAREI